MIQQVITYQTDMDHKSEFTKLDFTLVGALKEQTVVVHQQLGNRINSDG